MTLNSSIGIIDIGSNTVRLAVYQLTSQGAYRILDQGRWPARLSQRMNPDGCIPYEVIEELGVVLQHYRRICQQHQVNNIRAVATAAIRQAVNREEIVQRLYELTEISIEILSGEDEARIGSRAMLNTLSPSDCFVVDIGGGSTEVSLILNRSVVAAVSFPIGCVNMAAKYVGDDGPARLMNLQNIAKEVSNLLSNEKWISNHPGLPLIGLGGTVRALAKLHQKECDYPFPFLNGYEISNPDITLSIDRLSQLTVHQRSKLPGLASDRADVIVPGLAILRAVMNHMQASHLLISGVGLRDGLFYETCLPHFKPSTQEQLLEESIRNFNTLYPVVPEGHLNQVRKLAMTLYDQLASIEGLAYDSRRLLDTAARLFRIGAVIDHNDCADHTFYILLHKQWSGLSQREIILTAAIAAYRTASSMKQRLSRYRSMLKEGDLRLTAKLGSLLQLATALDRSESQAIHDLTLSIEGNVLKLSADSSYPLPVEQMEVSTIAKEVKRNWGITPQLFVQLV